MNLKSMDNSALSDVDVDVLFLAISCLWYKCFQSYHNGCGFCFRDSWIVPDQLNGHVYIIFSFSWYNCP